MRVFLHFLVKIRRNSEKSVKMMILLGTYFALREFKVEGRLSPYFSPPRTLSSQSFPLYKNLRWILIPAGHDTMLGRPSGNIDKGRKKPWCKELANKEI